MTETTPTPTGDDPAGAAPAEKPTRATRPKKARLGAVVKLSDTGGYGIVVGTDEVCRLGPVEKHELETEPVE